MTTSPRRLQLRYEADGASLGQLVYNAHNIAQEAFGAEDPSIVKDVNVEIGLVHAVEQMRSEDGPIRVTRWRADVSATGDLA